MPSRSQLRLAVRHRPRLLASLLFVASATAVSLVLPRLRSDKSSRCTPLVVIAGPPAAGKTTLCKRIKKENGWVHIATGSMLREHVKNATEIGIAAKEYMDAGELVPSELVVDLVKHRVLQDDTEHRGCLLDGFPRSPTEAQGLLDAGLNVTKFLLIEVPDAIAVDRSNGRRLDPESGEIYHLKFVPPPEEAVSRLVHRNDDQESKMRTRLQIYRSSIYGILPFFEDVTVTVDGTGTPDDVFDLVMASLDET